MLKQDNVFIIVTALILGWGIGLYMGNDFAVSRVRNWAVDNKLAHYEVIDSRGNTEFRWNIEESKKVK